MQIRLPALSGVTRLLVLGGVVIVAVWGFLRVLALFPGWTGVATYVPHVRQPLPIEVPVTRTVTRWKTRTETIEVKVYEPTPKEAEKLERETGFRLEPTSRTLGIFDTPKAPRGGKAWVRLDEEGATRFSFVENKAPFLELGGPWRVGVGASFDQDRKIGYEAELKKDLLTLRGNWHLSAAARASLVDSETDVQALVRLERSF